MSDESRRVYEFGRFRFDAERLTLECNGEPMRLPPRSLETLSVLLEKRGKVVTREDLLDRIWAESFVEDANLTVAVSTLRKALAAFDDATFIQTIPRKGYRFVGDARETSVAADRPIIIERHAVEEITIRTSPWARLRPRILSPRALIVSGVLIAAAVAAGTFAAWSMGRESAVDRVGDGAAFQRGKALMDKRLTVCDSISYYREAIARDPGHARAYAKLAAALAMCSDPAGEAKELAARALQLGADTSDAHATDGFIKMFLDWDWAGAESSLRRAVVLEPDSAEAHHWLGVLLTIRGRLLEGRGEIRRAAEIDPASPLYRADLCQALYLGRDPVAAMSECRRAEELDPEHVFTLRYLRDIYLMMGDERGAWEYEAKYLGLFGRGPAEIARYGEIVSSSGFAGYLESGITHHLDQYNSGNSDPKSRVFHAWVLANTYALLHDRQNSLVWLERAFEGERGDYPFESAYLAVDPDFDLVRDDPRYAAVLAKMGLK